jgi:hypothetical protein
MKIARFVLSTIGAALLLSGCYSHRHDGYTHGPASAPTYDFDYYPEAQVYYYPQQRVYYWTDGGAWRSGPRVPQYYVLRAPVRVRLNAPEPYRYHEQVREQYPPGHHQRQQGPY